MAHPVPRILVQPGEAFESVGIIKINMHVKITAWLKITLKCEI